MIKDIFKYNRKKIIAGTVIVLLVLIVALGYVTIHSHIEKVNDKEALYTIGKLTYSEDYAKIEANSIKKELENTPHSNKIKGLLYKSLAEVTYITGDEAAYNTCVGNANYYLSDAREYEELIALDNEYIGRLYANGSYSAAEALLERLSKLKSVEKLENRKIAAAYYLSYADVEQMMGNYDAAAENLEFAHAVIEELNSSSSRELQRAKMNILEARQCILTKDVKGAKAKLAEYDENSTLGETKNNYYVVCDFKIPYYELQAKINIVEGNYDTACEYVDKYVKYCDDYSFHMMKVNLLNYVVENGQGISQPQYDAYSKLQVKAYDETMTALAVQYGNAMLNNIDDLESQLKKDAERHDARTFVMYVILIALASAFVVLIVIYLMYQYLNIDVLTKFRNRRAYEKARGELEKHKARYVLAVMDIDDFKKVNDTYGHEKGDEVLKHIAHIISENCDEECVPYRYGGEELCIVMKNKSRKEVEQICESIRQQIENSTTAEGLRVTVSIGIGTARNGNNPFMDADKNLYIAKANGKNQVI